jgi:hypothetical protein
VADSTLDLGDVERLAGILDAVELDEQDRTTLHAVFALAGQAASSDEVSGFAFDTYLSTGGAGGAGGGTPPQGAFHAFTLGHVPMTDALNPQPLPP